MEGSSRGACCRGPARLATTVAIFVIALVTAAGVPAVAGSHQRARRTDQPVRAPAIGALIPSYPEQALLPTDPGSEVHGGADDPRTVIQPPSLTGDPELVASQQAAAEATSAYQQSAIGSTLPQRSLANSASSSLAAPLVHAGIGATDTSGMAPADAAGAAGVSYYLEAVNTQVAVYDQSDLHQIDSKGLAGFVGAPGDLVYQPQLLRDDVHHRWYYAAVRQASNGDNFIAFGWSKNGSPADLNAGWCNFFVMTPNTEDFPRLGQDSNRILIGTNVYSSSGGNFLSAKIRAIPKPGDNQTSCDRPAIDAWGNGTTPLQEPDGDLAFTPVPANTIDDTVTDYVVSADLFNTRDELNLWSIWGPKSDPVMNTINSVSVTPYAIPPLIPQPQTNLGLRALDTRLTNAVAEADPTDGGLEAVWTQHTVRDIGGGIAEVRWYEIVPHDFGNRLRQAGSISYPTTHVFNAAIAPTRQGNGAIIHYDQGNGSTLATLKASSRGPVTPLSQMDDVVTLSQSTDPMTDGESCGSIVTGCRWGDYPSISTDAHQDNTVWGSSELSGAVGNVPQWITKNFELTR
jgi:hypothetical protein